MTAAGDGGRGGAAAFQGGLRTTKQMDEVAFGRRPQPKLESSSEAGSRAADGTVVPWPCTIARGAQRAGSAAIYSDCSTQC